METFISYSATYNGKIILKIFFKLPFPFHITKIQLYVSVKLGNVQLAVR